jgi:hypothetical protein
MARITLHNKYYLFTLENGKPDFFNTNPMFHALFRLARPVSVSSYKVHVETINLLPSFKYYHDRFTVSRGCTSIRADNAVVISYQRTKYNHFYIIPHQFHSYIPSTLAIMYFNHPTEPQTGTYLYNQITFLCDVIDSCNYDFNILTI